MLVDFWAPWCGPCKQLTPVIEKVVKSAGGKVKLVKMNIDEHPQIAGQLGIKSIPAVIAFQRGQPIDGFMGALPESQVKQFVERLIGPLGAGDEEFAEAEAALEAGDVEAAADIYCALLEEDPAEPRPSAGSPRRWSRSARWRRRAAPRQRPRRQVTTAIAPRAPRSNSPSRRAMSAISPASKRRSKPTRGITGALRSRRRAQCQRPPRRGGKPPA